MPRNKTEREQRTFFFCASYLAHLLMCLNWAFNIPDYHLFTASKDRTFLLVQVPLPLEARKASLKWRSSVKCPRAGWVIQKCNTSNILIFTLKLTGLNLEIKSEKLRNCRYHLGHVQTCLLLPGHLLLCLKLELKVIPKRGRKRKVHLDTIWINTHYYLPHSQRCNFYSKLLLLCSLLVLIQPYTKFK